MKLGCWQEELQGLTEQSIPDILDYYSASKLHDPDWYKAWHSWAYMNFETVLFYKHQQNRSQSNVETTEGGTRNNAGFEVIFKVLYYILVIYIYYLHNITFRPQSLTNIFHSSLYLLLKDFSDPSHYHMVVHYKTR